MAQRPYRLAALQSHPIQYFAPLYRRVAQEPQIDLTVFYCSRQGLEEYVDKGFGQKLKWDVPLLEGYRHCFLPNLWRAGNVAGFFSLINPGIVRELRRGRFDALWVHGHGYATYVLSIVAAKMLGIPVLMRCETHLGLSRSPLKKALRRPVMSFLYRKLCRACLPIGTRNREFYRFHGVRASHLFMVPYSVDNSFFMRASELAAERQDFFKSELGVPASKPLILFVAKLLAGKRPLDLLQAYEKVRAENVDAALLFLGSGDQEELLKSYVQEHSLTDVHFLGFRNQSEVPKIYALADLLVFPSQSETWGLTINEAMCAGLPIIAAEEIGAVRDLVRHGDNGFVYKAGDVDALATHLKALIADGDLRHRMGKRSREIISGWGFEQCVQGIKEALAWVSKVPRRGALSHTRSRTQGTKGGNELF